MFYYPKKMFENKLENIVEDAKACTIGVLRMACLVAVPGSFIYEGRKIEKEWAAKGKKLSKFSRAGHYFQMSVIEGLKLASYGAILYPLIDKF